MVVREQNFFLQVGTYVFLDGPYQSPLCDVYPHFRGDYRPTSPGVGGREGCVNLPLWCYGTSLDVFTFFLSPLSAIGNCKNRVPFFQN